MTLKLNHINLSVPNVQEAEAFFETYFNFIPNGTKHNDTLAILAGADGFILVLMSERLNQKGNHGYPDAFHIGFHLSSEEEVYTIFNRLKAGTIPLKEEPQLIRKTLGFYFHHQNLMIEVAGPARK